MQANASIFISLLLAMCAAAPAQEWKPVPGHIMTRWAADVSPTSAHPEYPRPTMAREKWLSLNGLWEYAITTATEATPSDPAKFDGKILVPFPVESALSGVGRSLSPDQTLWYRRTFRVPAAWQEPEILLHFGAVDWQCEVRVNGKSVTTHRGGYDPFSVNITAFLDRAADNEIVVVVRDPTDTGGQPRGKQVLKPEGIWYTATSGIWQTVWIEPVPRLYIQDMHVRGDVGGRRIVVEVQGNTGKPPLFTAEVLIGEQLVGRDVPQLGAPAVIGVPNLRLWTPDDPFLYDVRVSLIDADGTKDTVHSYVGMRDVRVGPDKAGVQRILLNGQPLFQFGPLDQGFWPDGLYTPPTDAAMKADIEAVKKMGGNMLRKHVKVEPQTFYSWCDRLGVLVWQDIPSGNNPEEPAADRAQFETETKAIIHALRNHPSIIMWVPFNEGWGQFDTPRIVDMVMREDPRRLINNASGWTDKGVGDVIDVHAYPGPGMAPAETKRASVLGEFGGLGLPMDGHTWVQKDNWGYVSYKNQQELTDAYVALIDNLSPLITQGLSAAVYTQTTDVEIECNGWMTYDRALFKIDPERAAKATRKLFEPHGSLRTIVPTAAGARQMWRYTTTSPGDDWAKADFDDSQWQEGAGGFGTGGTPGATIGTEWKSADIWIRRSVELTAKDLDDAQLLVHHDEDAQVYINGKLVATLDGYAVGYNLVPLTGDAKKVLTTGRNTIAIHCHQTKGGQFIDLGLAQIVK